MKVLGIDPGVNHCGWGIVGEEGAEDWGLCRAPEWMTVAERCNYFSESLRFSGRVDLAVVEVPQVYSTEKQKGRQSDIVNLSLIAGACLAAYRYDVESPSPREWKGTVDKEAFGKRILKNLDLAEEDFARLKLPKKLLHNVVDGLGLALWGYNKLKAQQ